MANPQIVLPDAPIAGSFFDPRAKGKIAQYFVSWFKQLTNAHPFFPVDTTAGSQAITLPTGSIYLNQERLYQKTSADVHTVTISGAQGGAVVLGARFAKQRFRYDGTNWWPV